MTTTADDLVWQALVDAGKVPEYMTIAEVALALGCSNNTVNGMITRGDLKSLGRAATTGRPHLIDPRSVRDWTVRRHEPQAQERAIQSQAYAEAMQHITPGSDEREMTLAALSEACGLPLVSLRQGDAMGEPIEGLIRRNPSAWPEESQRLVMGDAWTDEHREQATTLRKIESGPTATDDIPSSGFASREKGRAGSKRPARPSRKAPST